MTDYEKANMGLMQTMAALIKSKAKYDAADALHVRLAREIHPDRNTAAGKVYEARKVLNLSLDAALADFLSGSYPSGWVKRWLEDTDRAGAQ